VTIFRKWQSIWLIHTGILLTFFLIPVWYRLPQSPIFARLYVTRFLIFLPMLWAIFWWLLLRLPGLRELLLSRSRTLWALALLALALWGFASQLWAFQRVDYPDVAQTAALQFGVSALFAVVVACAAPPPRGVAAVLVIALIPDAIITVLQAQTQGSLGLAVLGEFPFRLGQSGVSILESGALRWVRPYGLLPHPNLLAGALLLGLLAAASWLISARRVYRLAGIAAVALGWWALLLTFSRSAWGGLVIGVLAVAPFVRAQLRASGARLSVAVAVGVALAVGLAFAVSYQPLLAARAGEGEENVELRSVSDRLIFTQYALRSVSERPILGVGIGNFPWRMSYYLAETNYDLRGDNVHHVLLSVAAELGIVGLALLLLALLAGLVAAVKSLRACEPGDDRAARLALFAAFIALFAIGFLDHYPWTLVHFQAAWWGSLALVFRRS
jgi:O-antigen ligase